MDEKLIKAIKEMSEGKESGFNVVYSETYNHVYFRAKQHMNDEEDALDLTQIVFVEAFKNISTLQAPEALFGWLDRITYNQGMKLFRKKKEVLLTEEGEGVFDTLESNDIESMPELSMDQKETSKIIREIIEELPEPQKVALIAYYFDHYSVGQIAEMEECSEGTIKSRLNYARKYIKDRVEEKEESEGYRLHVFAIPTLLWAIRLLAESTKLSAQKAQLVYNGACSAVGLNAGTIGAGAGGTIGADATGKVSATVVKEATGDVVKEAGKTVVQAVGKAPTIGGKIAALTGTAKVFIVIGIIVLIGATVGTVAYVSEADIFSSNEDKNDVFISEDEDDGDIEKDDSDEMSLDYDNDGDILGEGFEFIGNEQAISEEPAAKTEFEDAEMNQLGIAISYASEFDMYNQKASYVFGTRMYIDKVLNGREYVPGILPCGWTSNEVTSESVYTFWKDGFGIEIPSDYSYVDDMEFWGTVSCTSERSWDLSLEKYSVISINVTDNADGTYTIEGVVSNEDIFEGGSLEKPFSAICELSGNSDVFCGYRIVGLGENAIDIDWDDIAEKYEKIARSADVYDVKAAVSNGAKNFFIDDIDSNGIPEFIMPTPNASEAERKFMIYTYDPSDRSTYLYGAIDAGHAANLFAYVDNDHLIIEMIQMGYDEAYDADPSSGAFNQIYSYAYPEEEYGNLKPKFKPGDEAYEIPSFTDLSLAGIKNELKRFQ